jgi:2-hydroxycyclohexanecarboxyl-CoA dehydrogenase
MSVRNTSRIAVVTAAGTGIGQASAIALARSGVQVVVADIDLAAADATVKAIVDDGGKAVSAYVDCGDQETIRSLHAHVMKEVGTPWILVNNSGWSGVHESLLDNKMEVWEQLARVNYIGTLLATQLFVKAMVVAGKGGRVVNIGSDSARGGSPIETAYSATKGAINALTKSFAMEMISHGICVNCVSPGPVDTPRLRRAPLEAREAWMRALPIGRFAKAEEVAAAVCFFASEEASYITGQILSVSAGAVMAG